MVVVTGVQDPLLRESLAVNGLCIDPGKKQLKKLGSNFFKKCLLIRQSNYKISFSLFFLIP